MFSKKNITREIFGNALTNVQATFAGNIQRVDRVELTHISKLFPDLVLKANYFSVTILESAVTKSWENTIQEVHRDDTAEFMRLHTYLVFVAMAMRINNYAEFVKIGDADVRGIPSTRDWIANIIKNHPKEQSATAQDVELANRLYDWANKKFYGKEFAGYKAGIAAIIFNDFVTVTDRGVACFIYADYLRDNPDDKFLLNAKLEIYKAPVVTTEYGLAFQTEKGMMAFADMGNIDANKRYVIQAKLIGRKSPSLFMAEGRIVGVVNQ